MIFGFVIKEAIASTALEHGHGCRCVVCRANAGDVDAFARIALSVQNALTDDEIMRIRELPEP